MEIEQDPLLSFAYKHSLVKQLTTPKPKHTTMNNSKDPGCGVFDGIVISPNQSLRKGAQKQYHKKQVRRRLHTSRPYQERLLNMAEARREIVTALKYHRASMKQATEEQQPPQQSQSLSSQTSHVSTLDQDGRFKSRRNPRIHPSRTTKVSNHIDDFSYSSSHPPPNSYPNTNHVITSPFANPPTKEENPNFTLPNQTLGLSLNLHHFNNLEATLFLNNNNHDNSNSSLCSYSSQTSSSPPFVTDQDHVPSVGKSHLQGEGVSSVVDKESNATIHATRGLHTAMDDEGMAEIRSLGEQHQMEWNDTMSLVTSAWWFNCLKNMEPGATHHEDGACQIFGELNEFPTLFNNNANERSLEQSSEDYFQDPTLHW